MAFEGSNRGVQVIIGMGRGDDGHDCVLELLLQDSSFYGGFYLDEMY